MRQFFKHVLCVVNPVSGRPFPVLYHLNRALSGRAAAWDVVVTKEFDFTLPNQKQLKQWETELIMIYGGDGTVMEVAVEFIDADIPLFIVPGGTANVVAVDLGVPPVPQKALELFAKGEGEIVKIDSFLCNEKPGLIRVSQGVFADVTIEADEEGKERFGSLAYSLASLKGVIRQEVQKYFLKIDGEEHTLKGAGLMVTNAPGVGWENMRLHPNTSFNDGKLDVIILKDTQISTLSTVSKDYLLQQQPEALEHFQGKRIYVELERAQTVVLDDEGIEEVQSLEVEVKPESLSVMAMKGAV